MRTKPSTPQFTPRESDLEEDQASLLTQSRIVSATEQPVVAEGNLMNMNKIYDEISEASKLASFSIKSAS